MATIVQSSSASTLHSALLPGGEHPKDSFFFFYFATVINGSEVVAKNCRIEINSDLPLKLEFWKTEAKTNRGLKKQSEDIDILPKESQTFAFTLMFYEKCDTSSLILYPRFVCDTLPAAPQILGTNSIDLTGFTLGALVHLSQEQIAMLLADRPVDRTTPQATLKNL